MSSIATKRLAKELFTIKDKGTPAGITLLHAEDLMTWYFTIEVLGESVYAGEIFALRFTFGPRYPIDCPEVVWVVDDQFKAPVHPHCYSNGHICASILGNEWSPVLNVQAVCLTLQSMIASCKKKEKPKDNDSYVKRAPKSPKDTMFHYDDDTV
ncbi:ubiquitin-conjugating enzyme/RWD-like protein [Mrakia frigida]|uniref:ubiquitin-conjugating enzyme E2 n=1 Tax=Mrakia frigida TaxID=29902 RepID=UPI003FCBF494